MKYQSIDLSPERLQYITENGKLAAVILDLSSFQSLRDRLGNRKTRWTSTWQWKPARVLLPFTI